MKKTDIEVGKFYVTEISGNLSIIKVTYAFRLSGWSAVSIKTGTQVIIKTASHLLREATESEVASKKVGTRLIKFEILDGPRVEGFDEIVKQLMSGATLLNAKPIPEATIAIFDRIARGEPDFQVGSTLSPDIAFLTLAQIVQDLTWWVETEQDMQDLRDMTGTQIGRCEEILAIRDKLIDLLK